MQECINPLCKQNFPNQFWMQGTLHRVYTPLAQKGKNLRIRFYRDCSLLHLGVNMNNLNAWPTVYEEDDLLYFLLSTVSLNWKFLKMFFFNIFISHWCIQPVSCHLWKFLLGSDYCCKAQIYALLSHNFINFHKTIALLNKNWAV